MDVRCERCGTEYDFDDALVSERGTTVKCTNCGYQFKVFPRSKSGVGPERWVVQLVSGGVVAFTTLRELQKGIAAGKVGPADQLSRGGQPPRPLSSIAELEPFFRAAVPKAGVGGKTLAGVAPPTQSDGGFPPQPFLPSKSDRPPPMPPQRKHGATEPRLPTFDRLPRESPEPRTQRRPDPVGGESEQPTRPDPTPPKPPVEAEAAAAPSDDPSLAQTKLSEPPSRAATTRAAPDGDTRVRLAEPGRLRADAGGVLADTFPGDSLRSPDVDSAAKPPPVAAATRGDVVHKDDTQRPVAAESSSGKEARAEAAPSAAAAPEKTSDTPAASETPTTKIAVSASEQRAAATKPSAPTIEATSSRSEQPRDVPAVAPVEPAPAETEQPRDVPAVAPVEPAPADAVQVSTARRGQPGPEQFYTPPPRKLSLSGSRSDPDPRYVPPASTRGARARWIVGLVLLGALVLLAGTVGQRFVRRYARPEPARSATTDPRVAEFVAAGRRKIDAGDLDGAAEELSKASVLAEKDPSVLLALAELELVRADVLWLQLRLLDPRDEDRVGTLQRQLEVKVARAREAVDAAAAVAPNEVALTRVKVDVLRLSGRLGEARKLVKALSENASQPANAYVLAALDLAEAQPAFKSAIEQLREPVSAEGKLGRARAALVYALASNGEIEAARAELTTLAGANPGHPLLPDLRAFLRRLDDRNDETGHDANDAGPDVDAPEPPSRDEDTVAGDFRARLAQANSALHNGLLDQAGRLFRGVLDEQPGNTEAMAGLAEVARQRNDPKAGAMYDSVLEKNPSYLPALVARADQKWDAGDREGALTLYRRILSQAGPTTSYGRHAQARIAQSSAGGKSTPAPTPPTPKTSHPAPTPAPSPEPSDIDTTDLPGFQ